MVARVDDDDVGIVEQFVPPIGPDMLTEGRLVTSCRPKLTISGFTRTRSRWKTALPGLARDHRTSNSPR